MAPLRLALACVLVAASTAIAAGPSVGIASASVASGPAYKQQPSRRSITVGSEGPQFTDDQFRSIAADYGVVVLTKFHGNWDIAMAHAAARRLKELNPNIKVYGYISTKFWFDRNNWGVDINPDWFLHDQSGALIPKVDNGTGQTDARYVDVSNPDYRTWVLDVAKSWMGAAPYDGVRFDAADPIGDYGQHEINWWNTLLTPEKKAAYNAGINDLLTRANDLLPSVLYNGFSPSDIRGPDRDLFMLDFTDGAMNEQFCTNPAGVTYDPAADIAIMAKYPTKSLQERAGVDASLIGLPSTNLLARFCLGVFDMGWQPGSTHFNFGAGYGLDQLGQQPTEVNLNLGNPAGAYVQSGAILSRRFQHGTVYVNTATVDTKVVLSQNSVEFRDGARKSLWRKGIRYTVPAGDAAFFLDADWVGK